MLSYFYGRRIGRGLSFNQGDTMVDRAQCNDEFRDNQNKDWIYECRGYLSPHEYLAKQAP